MKFLVEKKTIEEFALVEKAIANNDKNFDQMYETWKILDNFFARDSYEKDPIWRITYFRIYVRLTWKMIGTIVENDKFIEIIRRQVPMAILLDIDVLQEMMWYLSFNRAEKNQLVSLYFKIKSAFIESQEVVGVWQGQDVLVKDLVAQYVLLQKRKADSIEQAEFISKLRQVLFPKQLMPFIFIDPDAGINKFLELIEFFQEIDNEKIWFVVDLFLNPEQLENPAPSEENVEEEEGEIEAENSEEELAVPAASPASENEIKKQPAPQEIKSQIESEFKKDSEGNFENIEGVMRKLEEFTEMYNDPKIADMIYFDEEDNRFKWKM
jgi:hypothetical protein